MHELLAKGAKVKKRKKKKGFGGAALKLLLHCAHSSLPALALSARGRSSLKAVTFQRNEPQVVEHNAEAQRRKNIKDSVDDQHWRGEAALSTHVHPTDRVRVDEQGEQRRAQQRARNRDWIHKGTMRCGGGNREEGNDDNV